MPDTDPGEFLPRDAVAVCAAEARLLHAAATADVQRLAGVPRFAPASMEALPLLVRAAEDAEAAWEAIRDDGQRDAVRHVRPLALALLRDLSCALALLPDGGRLLAGLPAGIGTGACADLAYDLTLLSDLCEGLAGSFSGFPLPHDPPHRARNHAQVLAATCETPRALDAFLQRNRAAFRLGAAAGGVRAALAWVLRGEPATVRALAGPPDPRPLRRRTPADERLAPGWNPSLPRPAAAS